MARNPRRFRVWPQENVTGVPRVRANFEGVLFTDGTVVLRLPGGVATFHGQTVEQLAGGGHLFPTIPDLEWLDGAHEL